MFGRTRPDTHPVIARPTLGHLGLGPYSRDGEEDKRGDLCEEHRGQRDEGSMERDEDREEPVSTECQLLSYCLWGESRRSRAWQMKAKQSDPASICEGYVRLRYDLQTRIIPGPTYRLAARWRISKIQALLFAPATRVRGSNATYTNTSSTQLYVRYHS